MEEKIIYPPRVSHRQLKLKLMAMDPHCHWCKREVKDYEKTIPERWLRPDDEATLDHLISRYFRKKGDVVEKVLSCRRCNMARADEELKKYGPAADFRSRHLLDGEGVEDIV